LDAWYKGREYEIVQAYGVYKYMAALSEVVLDLEWFENGYRLEVAVDPAKFPPIDG
jgi:hypothetical protein